MNHSVITRMERNSESTGKYRWTGIKSPNGEKKRKFSEYKLKTSNLARRKQTKINYDTYRREEIPNEFEMHLDYLHYANFLGDKTLQMTPDYNTAIPVNLDDCDLWIDYLGEIQFLFQ